MPVGVATAVYLHEYAPKGSRLAALVRVAVTNLAGVPSIVFGLFGLGFFVQFVGRGLDRVVGDGQLRFGQPALVWAALTLAILTLPVVIVATEEALRSVPSEWRDASLALGATRSQTLARVVLPCGAAGHPHRRHPRRGAGRGRGGADPLHRRRLLPPRPPPHAVVAVHAPRLPHLRAGDAVAGRGGGAAAPLRDGLRPPRAHLRCSTPSPSSSALARAVARSPEDRLMLAADAFTFRALSRSRRRRSRGGRARRRRRHPGAGWRPGRRQAGGPRPRRQLRREGGGEPRIPPAPASAASWR